MFNPLILIAMVLCCLTLASRSTGASRDPPAPRYTFSWPLEGANLKPRGGTSQGPAVELDRNDSDEWQALQERGLPPRERDRRAILAMAGTYRVTFDFLEIALFGAQDHPNAPYQSWATEKVYVDQAGPRSVSLVHILEMRIVENGLVSEPIITKHWRQDWNYEPERMVEFRGLNRWESTLLPAAMRRGAWSQTVTQVDESPRYASIGRWQHTASFSTWLSAETWRPLPRREWTARDDYQALIGTNRHTILPTGWIQEENNLKSILTPARLLSPEHPYLAREYGVARYERIKDVDFAAADRYYASTKAFWDQVRDTWSAAFARHGGITLQGPVDKLGLFMPLFARADDIQAKAEAAPKTGGAALENGQSAAEENRRIIGDALRAMGVP